MNSLVKIAAGLGPLLFAACAPEHGGEEPRPEIALWGEQSAPVSYDKFKAAAYKESGEHGKYIVDGDIALADDEALRDYYESWFATPDALTVKTNAMDADVIWPQGQRRLSYCVSTTFGAQFANVEVAMRAATGSWSRRIGVAFEYRSAENGNCNASNLQVTFDVSPTSNQPYFARAFWPDDHRSVRNVLIDGSSFGGLPSGMDLAGVLGHELGHSLGFRHEHIWLHPQCTAESTASARQVTAYDANSIMHYPQCRPLESGGMSQTELDYKGALSLYGLAPALIVNASPSMMI